MIPPHLLVISGRDGLSAVSNTDLSFRARTNYIQLMNLWSKRPGKKVTVPRFSLESWAQHMADPKQYARMLREHAGSIREQSKLLDKRKD